MPQVAHLSYDARGWRLGHMMQREPVFLEGVPAGEGGKRKLAVEDAVEGMEDIADPKKGDATLPGTDEGSDGGGVSAPHALLLLLHDRRPPLRDRVDLPPCTASRCRTTSMRVLRSAVSVACACDPTPGATSAANTGDGNGIGTHHFS